MSETPLSTMYSTNPKNAALHAPRTASNGDIKCHSRGAVLLECSPFGPCGDMVPESRELFSDKPYSPASASNRAWDGWSYTIFAMRLPLLDDPHLGKPLPCKTNIVPLRVLGRIRRIAEEPSRVRMLICPPRLNLAIETGISQ